MEQQEVSMCSSYLSCGEEVFQEFEGEFLQYRPPPSQVPFTYKKEMDEVFHNKSNIHPEILLDGSDVVAKASSSGKQRDEAVPAPSGNSTKDPEDVPTFHTAKKRKVKGPSQRIVLEERINYQQRRLEMEQERQKKRDERKKKRLELKEASLEVKHAVLVEKIQANKLREEQNKLCKEQNMLLRKYFEARLSFPQSFRF